MALAFSCPHCHKAYRVDDKHAGRKTKCRVCDTPMVVPRVTVPPAVVEQSAGGIPVIRHQAPTAPPPMVSQATPFLPHISRHIEKTIGPAPMVFHEIVSTSVHLDLHLVGPTHLPPSDEHPFGTDHVTVVTSGVSSLPMNVPPGYDGPRFIELMIALPADWPGLLPDGTFDQKAMKDERNWWPFRWLKNVARLPAELNTFLGLGHTIPNGERAAPFAKNTRLGCMMVSPPMLSPESFKLVVNDHASIYFFALTALYPEEMNLKLRGGSGALDPLMDAACVTELIQIDRPNVALRRG